MPKSRVQEKTFIIGNVGDYHPNEEYGDRPPRHLVASPRSINLLLREGWKIVRRVGTL